MDDAQQYIMQLEERSAALETVVNAIKKAQQEAARQRVIERDAFAQEIVALTRSVEENEQMLMDLAQATKKLITTFQHMGMQSQLQVLRERTDMLSVENWITKKELKRLLAK